MCTPGAAIALQGASAVTGAYGAYSQGMSEAAQYRYASAAKQKEAAATRAYGTAQTTAIQDQAALESAATKQQTNRFLGAQKAQLGANTGGGSVTAQDILKDTLTKGDLDQAMIRYNADLKSKSVIDRSNMSAFDLENEAAGYGIAASGAKRGAKTAAFNSLLSGAGQVANTWYTSNLYRSPSSTANVGGKRVPTAPSDYYRWNSR